MTDVETPQDAPSPVEFWRAQIGLANKEERVFREDGEVIERRRDGADLSDYQQTDHSPVSRFNILWANTETLKPAVYSAMPNPDVRVRNFPMDLNDPAQKARAEIAQEAATVLERALSASIDDGLFDCAMKMARDDVLLPGRGQVRCRYVVEWETVTPEPVFQTDEAGAIVTDEEDEPIVIAHMHEGEVVDPERDDEGNLKLDDDGFPQARVKKDERVETEYVFWKSYRQEPARTWEETNWIAYEHFMEREELIEAFGSEIGKAIPLNARRAISHGEGVDEESRPPDAGYKVARLWEIYDRRKMERIWIADGFPRVVEQEDDPMQLEGFYPSPRPLVFYMAGGTTIPRGEFRFYRDQAVELDTVNGRITRLVAFLKATGGYDSLIEKIVDIHSQRDGELAPIEIGDEMRERGGLQGSIWMWPLKEIADTLVAMYNQRAQLLQQIYELTGISDLIRGQTRATETLGAQRLKANFGSMRMTNRTQPMNEFVRDTLRIMGELMAENFEKETFERMAGMSISDEAMAMLRDNHLRYFNIDIEADSTVTPDAEMQKQEATEFARAVVEYINAVAPLMIDPRTGQPSPVAPLLLNLFKVVFRRFKMSREIDTEIDEMIAQLEQVQQPVAQPGLPQGPQLVQP